MNHADQLKIDAARYRFLRIKWEDWTGNTWSGTPEQIAEKLDRAIDEQMPTDICQTCGKHMGDHSETAVWECASRRATAHHCSTPAPQGQAVEAKLREIAFQIAQSLYGYFEGGSAGAYEAMMYFANYRHTEPQLHLIERVYNHLRPLLAPPAAPAGEATMGEPSDKQMLDWLTSQVESTKITEAGYGSWRFVSPTCQGTVRDALRAAMKAALQSQQGAKPGAQEGR